MRTTVPLRVKSFRIQRFKAIGDATLHWHPRVNIITGPNNCGKTTVLEAFALWVVGFYRICRKAGKASRRLGVQRGDWYLDSVHVHHREIVSTRSPGYDDLFHQHAKELYLTATFDVDGSTVAIPIKIRKARGSSYDLSCASSEPHHNHVAIHRWLNRSGLSWPHPFRVIFASPIAALQTTEEFLTPGKVDSILRQRRSAEVLRNRLFRLHASANDFQLFTDNVGYVLNGDRQGFEIRISGDPGRDVLVKALACTSSNDRPRDISLLGSGSLQIIEILLNLYLDSSDLNLVLLDEPDSHIHRDIQRRLLEVIETKTEKTQVFATTHNESMLRNTSWDRVFHLTPAPVDAAREFRPIANSHVIAKGRKHGLLASPLRSVMSSLGAETSLDFLNALESEHFLLVEGPSDAALFEHLFNTLHLGRARDTAMYWSLGGIDRLRSLPGLQVVLSEIRNSQTLWEKARLVLDRDFLSPEHSKAIAKAFKGPRFKLRVSFWDAYTAEAVLLSGGASPALAHMLTRTTDESSAVEPPAAQRACHEAWAKLGEKLKKRWHGDQYMSWLPPMVGQRQKLFCELFPKVLPKETVLLKEIADFHRAAVQEEEYWQSATKDDVREFVQYARVGMGIRDGLCDGPNWFDAIIDRLRHPRDCAALLSMLNELRVDSR
ncbi:MAG TPA: hypothetical protein ENJ18_19495 [Nannocystis exedens]|nr:hypothetical protein [Nannocystis exedens]